MPMCIQIYRINNRTEPIVNKHISMITLSIQTISYESYDIQYHLYNTIEVDID